MVIFQIFKILFSFLKSGPGLIKLFFFLLPYFMIFAYSSRVYEMLTDPNEEHYSDLILLTPIFLLIPIGILYIKYKLLNFPKESRPISS